MKKEDLKLRTRIDEMYRAFAEEFNPFANFLWRLTGVRPEQTEKLWGGGITPRMEEVLIHRFIARRTLEEIGQSMGVTRERIRQIEGKALVIFMQTMRQKIKAELENPDPPIVI